MKLFLKSLVVAFVLIAGILAFVYVPVILAERPRMGFQGSLKKRATAQDLHAWATQVLAPYQTKRDPELWVQVTNLPAAFQGLFELAPSAYICGDSQARFKSVEPVAYVKITYGAAAGHFGVVLGPTNLPAPASREHEIRYTPWAPGAWFFDGQ